MRGGKWWLLALFWVASVLSAQPQNSCISCHEQQEDEELALPVQEWKTSIHAENGISCQDCHGGDPRAEDEDEAMDPDRGFVGAPLEEEIPEFCGKCHSAVYDNYMQSAHAKALLAGEEGPTCVTCHTAHKQQKVSLDLINEETCGSCHEFDRALKIREAMRAMDEDLVQMEVRVDLLFREGFDVESERKALFALRNRAHRLTHVLDLDRILLELGGVRTDLQRLDSRVITVEKELSDRKKLGLALIALFLLGALIAWAYHKSLMKE